MVLQASGQISFSQIAAEFKDPTPISFSDFYRGKKYITPYSSANNSVPSSGAFAVSTLYGATSTQYYSEQTRLQASDAAGSDQFGVFVALSSDGTTMAVGANLDDNSGGTDAGSVYIWTRSGSTWTQQTRLQASDAAAFDYFGVSVELSSDGTTLAVGAHYDANSGGSYAGSVYIFTGSGSTWTEQTRLQASDAAANDFFGFSVALSSDGNNLAVGAYNDDNSGGTNAGSVYIYTRSGSTWTQQSRLQASDAATNDGFGSTVAVSSDGNTLAVGANGDDSGGTDAGSVYVWTRSGSTWTQQTRLQASDAATTDFFGGSVALSSDGNTLAVGATGDDNSGGTDAGSVYVWTRSGSTWTQQTRLQASDAAASDFLGNSTALSSDGNTLAVGAYADNNSGGTDAGSVYVWTRSGSTWTQQSILQASDAAASDNFGQSVALSSDGITLAVGAFKDDNSGGVNAGSVYVFQYGDWAQTRLQASDAAASDNFGHSVALSSDGTIMAVGAYFDDTSGGLGAGSVYIWKSYGSVWGEQTRLQASDAATNDSFGTSVAFSSDGATIAVGAPSDDNSGGADAGSVYIYQINAWFQSTRLQASDAAASDFFGQSVALSLDGTTLAVGVDGDDNSGGTDAGSVYIYTRSGNTWTQQTRLQASDAVIYDQFGVSVALSSDGNSLAVGARFDDNSAQDAGSVYIFTRSGSTWTQLTRLQASDAALSDYFGICVALSSDGNILAVGAYTDDNSGGTSAGSVYIFTCSGSTWTQQSRLQASDAGANDFFGRSVALTSDGNNLAVGGYGDSNSGGTYAGSAYIYTRSGSTWTQQTRLQASDAVGFEYFGWSVALSSDGNLLAVGSYPDDNSGGTDAGSVYIFTRSGSTWTQQSRLQASDAAASDYFGYSVALTSDGATLAIGAYYDDNSGGTDAGSVYIWRRSGSTWTQRTRLQASDAAASDKFGRSVALTSDGDTLAVGSYSDDNSGGADAGSVYVFEQNWTEQTRLQASDAAASDSFGFSVAVSSDGNTLAVGAYMDDFSALTNPGSVYVFTRSGSTWTQQSRLQASDASGNDQFGWSVALSSDGNTLAVGALDDDNSGGTDAGSVYVWTRSGSTWTQQTRLQASDAAGSDNFGRSVDVSSDGNTLAVGSYWDDNTGGTDAGSVYIFTRSGSTWTQQSRLQASDAAVSDRFGNAVALSSNGNTLAVGADGDDVPVSAGGSVYIWNRSGSTWTQVQRVQASDAAASDLLGQSVVVLSSDGNTMAIGARMDDNSGGADAGSVYVLTFESPS